jgi:hypothetical protein
MSKAPLPGTPTLATCQKHPCQAPPHWPQAKSSKNSEKCADLDFSLWGEKIEMDFALDFGCSALCYAKHNNTHQLWKS